MKHFKIIVASLFVVMLYACSSQPQVPEDRFYRLPAADSNKQFPSPEVKLFMVGPILARGIYNERAILYINSEQPLEVMRYHYHYWLQSPAQLIQENLVYYLRGTGIAREVVSFGTGFRSDYTVRGRLLRFERLINKDGVSVVAGIEFTLEKSGKPLFTHAYEATRKVPGDSIHATAQYMGQVLVDIYQRLLVDIKKTIH